MEHETSQHPKRNGKHQEEVGLAAGIVIKTVIKMDLKWQPTSHGEPLMDQHPNHSDIQMVVQRFSGMITPTTDSA